MRYSLAFGVRSFAVGDRGRDDARWKEVFGPITVQAGDNGQIDDRPNGVNGN